MSTIFAASGRQGRVGKPEQSLSGNGLSSLVGGLVTPKRRAGEDEAGAAAALASRAAWRSPGTGRVRTVLVTPALLLTFPAWHLALVPARWYTSRAGAYLIFLSCSGPEHLGLLTACFRLSLIQFTVKKAIPLAVIAAGILK